MPGNGSAKVLKGFYIATLYAIVFMAGVGIIFGAGKVERCLPEKWGGVWLAACATAAGIPAVILCGIYLWFPAALITSSEIGLYLAGLKWLAGERLYHGAHESSVYSLLYGPAAFLPYALALKYTGSLAVGKVMALCVATTGLTIIVRRVWSDVPSPRGRFWISSICAILLLPQLYMLLNAKSDPFLLLYAAVPLLSRHPRRMLVLAATGCSLTLLTKFTGVAAFVPYLALWWTTPGRRWSDWAIAVAVGGGLTAGGLALPGVSAAGFIEWAKYSSRHALEWPLLAMTLPIAGPVVLYSLTRPIKASDRWLRRGIVCAFVLLLPASMKTGSGCYHFIPLLPATALLLARQWADENAVLVRWEVAIGGTLLYGLTGVILGTAVIYYYPESRGKQEFSDAAERAYRILPQPYSLILSDQAAGGRFEDSFAVAFVLGAEVPLSPIALWDTEAAGMKLPLAAQDRALSCESNWVVPEGATPWASTSGYYRAAERDPPKDPFRGFEHHLLGRPFVTEWNRRFHKVGTIAGFDVYRCR